MKFLLAVLLLIITPLISNAQPITPGDYGLREFSINHKELGLIKFYVDTTNIKTKAPLFIETNGSGGLPLCLYIKGKKFASTSMTFNREIFEKTRKKYHYVILGKPGTPFCDSVGIDATLDEYQRNPSLIDYKVSDEYTKRLSLDWRVEATKTVVTYLAKNNFWDQSKLIAYGFSEGGQVVPALAVADKRVTHVVPIVGSGLNQLYNDILAWRFKAQSGAISHQEAQDSIAVFLNKIKDIYQHPDDTQKEFGGHSYKRWASFGSSLPFENLQKLTIPIYLIAATADLNSPVYGLDYVQLDFIRLGKKNLTYDPCIGCDHYLNTVDDGKLVNHFAAYFQRILDWIARN